MPMSNDFTEEDLKNNDEDKQSAGGESASAYHVKSTPLKYGEKNKNIDPHNPYMNKNLDAELSETIGRHKKNRKQINTN